MSRTRRTSRKVKVLDQSSQVIISVLKGRFKKGNNGSGRSLSRCREINHFKVQPRLLHEPERTLKKSARLLHGDVADDRQLEHFVVVGLVH